MLSHSLLQIRRLDCAVIETLHLLRHREGQQPFDTARGFFLQGRELYPTAGFRELDHIQICVRSSKQIIGYFLLRGHSCSLPVGTTIACPPPGTPWELEAWTWKQKSCDWVLGSEAFRQEVLAAMVERVGLSHFPVRGFSTRCGQWAPRTRS